MSLTVPPFSLQLPSGYSLAAPAPVAATAATPVSTPPVDVVAIGNTWNSGTFTAATGDAFRLSTLLQGTAASGTAIAGYRLALGAGDGTLSLNGADVTARTSFTADEFSRLIYTAGSSDSQQSLVVSAQTGTRLADGSLIGVTDSPAVQLTADVTGSRSINAMAALVSTQSAADANVVSVAKEASILTGVGGAARPTVQTPGNFSAVAGDVLRVSSLFQSAGAAGYRLALGAGDGTLSLDGADVTSQTSFTAAEFSRLTYTVGASAQDLVVAAQTGTRQANGTLTGVTDSPVVQITASVAAERSMNALGALASVPDGTDADATAVVKEAAILTGLGGAARPTLQTQGDFTAASGDVLRMSDLFQSAGAAGYRLALGAGDGTLSLDGADVTGQTSFTADQFSRLLYTAGSDGGQQRMVIAAQTGTRLADGTLTRVTDSAAVAVTADVTGSLSINAMAALASTPSAADTDVASVAKEAAILTGVGGATRPIVQTAGNFTAAAGDVMRLSDLFQSAGAAGYRLALGAGGGTLSLDGADVTSQTSFTAAEFSRLLYTAGTVGSSQNLVVAAQTGTRLANGTLTGVTDSPAVEIAASVTGTRSINAMGALAAVPEDADANAAGVVREAAILTGIGGAARPTLRTAGNFSAAAGDQFRLSGLVQGAGASIAGYRLALGSGDGQLSLDGADVTDRTSFTAAEFSRLLYTAGSTGSAQNLVVAAQSGTRLADGTLIGVTDSTPVRITASVNGADSINAIGALASTPAAADAGVVSLVKEAGILTGIGGVARPGLQTVITPAFTESPATLSAAIGAYNTAARTAQASLIDLSLFDAGAVGGAEHPGVAVAAGGSLATALLLLDGTATGAFQTPENAVGQTQAIKAYETAQSS